MRNTDTTAEPGNGLGHVLGSCVGIYLPGGSSFCVSAQHPGLVTLVSWVTSCLKIGRITDQLLTQISDLMGSWESVEEVVGQVRALNAATEMVLEDT